MSTATGVTFAAPEATPIPTPAELYVDPIDAAVLEIFKTRGWTKTAKSGAEVVDDAACRQWVYEYFRDHVVVNNDADVATDGLSMYDLFAKTFPGALSALKADVEDPAFAAYEKTQRKIWNWAGPKFDSPLQEAAELDGVDLVMCEKKVYRTVHDVASGAGAVVPMPVRFFTSDPDLVFTLSTLPATAKLVKAAEATAKHLEMNLRRRPELAARIAKEASIALTRSQAGLKSVTSKSAAALTASSDSD